MALSKKASRTIKVGTATYRWLVSEDSGYSVLVVQSESGFGQILEVIIDWESTVGDKISNSLGPVAVTPSIVSSTINQAVHGGWDPSAAITKPFRRRLRRDHSLGSI